MQHDSPGPDSGSPIPWVFEQSPHAMAVCSGEDLTVVECNATARRWLGLEDPIGVSAPDALPERYRRDVRRRLQQVLDSGVAFTTRDQPVALPRGSGDGQVLLDVVLRPWGEPGEPVRGVVVFASDVTHLLQGSAPQPAPVETEAGGLLAVMHDALLPASLPLLPRLSLAASYVLAPTELAAGGDWFDALPLPDGRYALMVGDVVGHGADGAALMSQLQAVARERLLSGAAPEAMVHSLDRYAAHQPEASGATLCVAVLEPETGELSYLTAGHPPPLVVDREGGFRYLAPSAGGPLGTTSEHHMSGTRLADDELLVLYSDGLVQQQHTRVSGDTIDLARAAGSLLAEADGSGTPDVDRVASGVMGRLVDRVEVEDDATVLVAARVTPPVVLRVALPADDDAVEAAVQRLADWLLRLGARALDRMAVTQACEEALLNVVEHAYAADDRGELRLRAELGRTGHVDLEVSDDGTWRDDDRPEVGWGLVLAGGMVDRMRVTRTDHGTTVDLRHRLTRPVSLLAAECSAPPVPAEAAISARPGRVEASGPLDRGAAARFRMALLTASRAGIVPVTVDLTAATIVTGAAVRELYAAAERGAAHGAPLTVVANPGCPAQHVLELVAMPYLRGEGPAA